MTTKLLIAYVNIGRLPPPKAEELLQTYNDRIELALNRPDYSVFVIGVIDQPTEIVLFDLDNVTSTNGSGITDKNMEDLKNIVTVQGIN